MPVVLNSLEKLLTGNINLAGQQNFTFRDLAITAVIGKLCPYCSFYGSQNSFESSVGRYFFSPSFRKNLVLVAIDEAHCICEWLAVANFISVVDIV